VASGDGVVQPNSDAIKQLDKREFADGAITPSYGGAIGCLRRIPAVFIGPIINCSWGLGTALFLSREMNRTLPEIGRADTPSLRLARNS